MLDGETNLSGAGGGGGGDTEFTQTPDNLRSEDKFEGLLALGHGRWKGLKNGLSSLRLNDTPFANGADANFPDWSTAFADGDPTAFPQKPTLVLGAGATPVAINVTLANTTGTGTPVVRTVSNTDADFIDLRFVVSQLYKQTKKGIFGHTATIRIRMKPSGHTSWIDVLIDTTSTEPSYSESGKTAGTIVYYAARNFYDESGNRTSNGGTSGRLTITGKTTSPYVKEVRIAVPNTGTYAGKGWDIEATLMEVESVDADPNFEKRTILWESASAVYKDTNIGTDAEWTGLAWLSLVGPASDRISGVPEVWGEYETKFVNVPPSAVYNPTTRQYTGTVWDGSWVKGFTDDPAWVINDALVDPLAGVSSIAPGSYLNKWDALELSKYCSELVTDGDAGTHPRFSINGVFLEPQKADEFIRNLAGAVGAHAWDAGNGEWRCKVDKIETPVAVFTEENIEGEFVYTHTDVDTRFNDITMVFKNAEFEYREDRVRVWDQADIDANGRKPTSLVALGCTNRQEALRRAMLRLRTSINEYRIVSFTTNRQGRFLEPLNTVLVADKSLGYEAPTGSTPLANTDARDHTTGRMIALDGPRTTITLRDPLRLEPGATYKIKLTVPNPVYDPTPSTQPVTDWDKPTIVIERNVTAGSPRGDVTSVIIDTALPADTPVNAPIALHADGLPTLPKTYRVLDINEDDDRERVSITAIEVDTGKYAASDGVTTTALEAQLPDSSCPPPIAPAGGVAVVRQFTSDYNFNHVLEIDWERPASRFILGYEVSYTINDGPKIRLPETKDTRVELPEPQFGTYDIEIVAVDRRGQRSIPLEATIEVDEPEPVFGYGSDNILQPFEKTSIIQEFGRATDERADIQAKADALGVSRVTYDAEYAALQAYLTGLSPAYTDLTQNTTIVRTTWNQNWQEFYVARQNLLNAIDAEAATRATWTSVDGRPATLAELDPLAAAELDAASDAINAAGNDDILTAAEKRDSIARAYARLEIHYKQVYDQATALGLSTTALTTARTAWQNLLNSYSPAWNDFDNDTTIYDHFFADKNFPTGWTDNGSGLTTTPNGIYTTVTDDSATYENVIRSASQPAAATQYSGALVVKKDAVAAATRFPIMRLTHAGGAGGAQYADLAFDTSTGEFTVGGTKAFDAHGVFDLGSEWLVWGSITTAADDTLVQVEIYPAVGNTTLGVYTDAATGSIDIRPPLIVQGDANDLGHFMLTGRQAEFVAEIEALAVAIRQVEVKVQWSVDGSTLWHDDYVEGDLYMRQSTDNGVTWGPAIRAVGEDGADGVSALSGYLTNESHTLAANSDGTVPDYSSAVGEFKVLLGTTDVTSGCTFSVVSESAGLDVSINGTAGNYLTVTLNVDTGTAVFRATHTASGQTIDKTFSIAKSRAGVAGDDGTDGTSPKILTLNSSHHSFKYDATGTIVAQTTTLTATRQNTSVATTFILRKPVAGTSHPITGYATQAGDVLTMTEAGFNQWIIDTGEPGVIVEAYVTDGGDYRDKVTLVKLNDGAPGTSNFTPVHTNANTSSPAPGTIEKVAGGAWSDARVRSAEGYVDGCALTFKLAQTNKPLMMGLTDAPSSPGANNYEHLDFSIYFRSDAFSEAWLNGAGLASLVSYAAGDRFSIQVDAGVARIYKNGTLIYTWAAAASRTAAYHFDSTYETSGAKVEEVSFVGKGSTGNKRSFVFKRSITQPTTPTGDGPVPSGWSDAPPADDGTFLWQSNAELSPTNVLIGSWTTPVRIDSIGSGNLTFIHDTANTVSPAPGKLVKVNNGVTWDRNRSAEAYSNGCVMSFRPLQANRDMMVGITTDPTAAAGANGFEYIDYAIHVESGGNLYIYQNGSFVNPSQTYAANDRLGIQITDGTARYFKNDVLIHTSTVIPSMTTPFYFTSAMLGIDGTIDQISFVGAGAIGLRPDVKFIRQNATPATPTGNDPAGWSDGIPSGTETIWQSRANKNGAGNIVGVWSPPQAISALTTRGGWADATAYYVNNVVTYNGGTYICTVAHTSSSTIKPSGTDQATGYWDVLAAPGADAPSGSGDLGTSGSRATVNAPASTTGQNLRSLADAAGYGGGNAYIDFVTTGSTTGLPGSDAIVSGTWPSDKTISLKFTNAVGNSVIGGGGEGGEAGFMHGGGSVGGAGGDGISLSVNFDQGIVNNGVISGGGGGGGGGGGYNDPGFEDFEGGGGGGGYPNGLAGTGEPNGSAGTTGGGGAGGNSTGGAGDGGSGGGVAVAGNTGGSASGAGGNGGVPGYAIRKNGFTATVSGSGTNNGTVG